MKCGSCRDKNADAYTRIKPDNKLFEILKSLNPKYTYNPKYSLYCNTCIKLAEAKLSNKSTSLASATVSALNPSISNNNSVQSDGSIDEYDSLVPAIVFTEKGTPLVYPPGQNKRPAAPHNRPCPKRHKKPIAQQEIASSQEATVSSQSNINQISSEQSSESNERRVLMDAIAEADSSTSFDEQISPNNSNNLLMVDDADDSSLSSADEQPRNATPHPVPDISISLSSKDPPNKRKSTDRHDNSDVSNASNRHTGTSGGHKSKTVSNRQTPAGRHDDDSDIENSTDQQALPGPSAPANRNPRIRDLRNYFSGRQVGSYSRSLGG